MGLIIYKTLQLEHVRTCTATEHVVPCPGTFLSCTFSLWKDQPQYLVSVPSPEYLLFCSSFSNTQQVIVLLKKTCSNGGKVY